MGKDVYYELTRRSVSITKNDVPYLAWRNSVLALRTSKGLTILEYSFNLEYLNKDMPLLESTISSPKDSPATELCNSRFLKNEMRNLDYTEMIVNPSFWPHNTNLRQEMTNVNQFEWSPPNFIKSESVLAILNNIGGVEIYCHSQLRWESRLNLTPYVKKALEYNESPKTFEELKESVYIVETSSICWANELNPDKSCYFVTAQKNGSILFWQIYNNMNTVKIQGLVKTDMTVIIRMLWIPKSQNQFCLVCSDVVGQIKTFDLKIENEMISFLQSHTLWQHQDKMIAKNLNYTLVDNHVVVICSKHRHLLIQVLSENGNILSQYLKNVNDYQITEITTTSEGIYLATVNVKMYNIDIKYLNETLTVDLTLLDIKDPYTTYDLCSLRFSPNNVICALVMADRRMLCRKEAHKVHVVFVTSDSKLNSIIPKLLDNPTKKLTYLWDCLELLRFQLIKLKTIPEVDLEKLYDEAINDAYKLKIYMMLLILFNNLKKVLRPCTVVFPETSIEVVKEKILYLHAQSTLNILVKTCHEEGNLTDIEMETLYGSKYYLEFYSNKYKIDIEFDKNILNALENNCEYVCQSCDEKINGFSCRHGHLNMFCMETFTPIMGLDYLLCKYCGTTARCDLNIEYPLCVFCDQNLIKPD